MSLFTRDEFYQSFPDKQLSIYLISQDTYDEKQLFDNVKKHDLYIMCAIAIQLSIIGFGRKTYGKVSYENIEIDVKNYFDDHKVNYQHNFNDKIQPNEITPRRLIRLFRYKIFDYLKSNPERSSYLYRKYCPQKDMLMRQWIFPGVEHLLSPEQENIEKILLVFIQTYRVLDTRQNTLILERIKRVLYARGFLPEKIEFYEKQQIDLI